MLTRIFCGALGAFFVALAFFMTGWGWTFEPRDRKPNFMIRGLFLAVGLYLLVSAIRGTL
jgi:hypothetical protein